jgi:transposase-like protein
MNLKAKIYTDETAARRHLEKLQWPDGPICPHCGVVNEATELQGDSTRPGVWKCRPCQKPFSVTVGTVFERSKIPLTKWLLATELLTSSKKGISSHQLSRMLDVTYKTEARNRLSAALARLWKPMKRISERRTASAKRRALAATLTSARS